MAIQADYLPRPPAGMELRARSVKRAGDIRAQWFTAGGFFGKDAEGNKMRACDLAKVAALTIDVDICDSPLAVSLGEDRSARKAALYAMSEEAVLAWMDGVQFVEHVLEATGEAGLGRPNRIIYTGHGLCLIYWMPDGEGYPSSPWSPSRMKDVIKAWHGFKGESLWWWDASAKDIGTRIFPVPGGGHRASDKTTRLYRPDLFHNDTPSFDPWFDRIKHESDWLPAPSRMSRDELRAMRAEQRKAKKEGRTLKPRGGDRPKVSWTFAVWPRAERPEDRTGCPSCGSNTSLRAVEDKDDFTCWKCNTVFRYDYARFKQGTSPRLSARVASTVDALPSEIVPTAMPRHALSMQDCEGILRASVELPLDERGYAQFPENLPDFVLLTARTGSGKTHLMEAAVKQARAERRRVLAISPFVSLAKNLAARLDLVHAAAGSGSKVADADTSSSFAALRNVTEKWKPDGSVILIDEIEQMLTQIYSMLKSKDAQQTYSRLVYCCSLASRIILADAHASLGTLNLIRDIEHARSALAQGACNFVEMTTIGHCWPFVHLGTPPSDEEDDVYDGAPGEGPSSSDKHIELIVSQVEAGKRVAIACYERKMAQAIGKLLEGRVAGTGRTVRVIVGSDGEADPEDFSQDALSHDVLVYNTAMSTGVSFDRVGWYDHRHVLVGRDFIGSASVVEQMLHRVRHPNDPRVFISGTSRKPPAADSWRFSPTAIEQHFLRDVETARRALGVEAKSTAYLLSEYRQDLNLQRLGSAQAASIAASYLSGRGWTLPKLRETHNFEEHAEDVLNSGAAEAVREIAKAIHLERATKIAEAAPLPEADMTRIARSGPRSRDEQIRHTATRYLHMFGGALSSADFEQKVDICSEALRGKLPKQVLAYAQQSLLRTGKRDAVARYEVNRSRGETAMTYRTVLPAARLAAFTMRELARRNLLDGRAIPFEWLAEILSATRREQSALGIPEGPTLSHAQYLAQVLRSVGLRLKSRRSRGLDGAIVRVYHLDTDRLELVDALSRRWQERIVEDDDYRERRAAATGDDADGMYVARQDAPDDAIRSS